MVKRVFPPHEGLPDGSDDSRGVDKKHSNEFGSSNNDDDPLSSATSCSDTSTVSDSPDGTDDDDDDESSQYHQKRHNQKKRGNDYIAVSSRGHRRSNQLRGRGLTRIIYVSSTSNAGYCCHSPTFTSLMCMALLVLSALTFLFCTRRPLLTSVKSTFSISALPAGETLPAWRHLQQIPIDENGMNQNGILSRYVTGRVARTDHIYPNTISFDWPNVRIDAALTVTPIGTPFTVSVVLIYPCFDQNHSANTFHISVNGTKRLRLLTSTEVLMSRCNGTAVIPVPADISTSDYYYHGPTTFQLAKMSEPNYEQHNTTVDNSVTFVGFVVETHPRLSQATPLLPPALAWPSSSSIDEPLEDQPQLQKRSETPVGNRMSDRIDGNNTSISRKSDDNHSGDDVVGNGTKMLPESNSSVLRRYLQLTQLTTEPVQVHMSPSRPPTQHRIELIGASVLCGLAILCPHHSPGYLEIEDATAMFATRACDELEEPTTCNLICWSGRGYERGVLGHFGPTIPEMYNWTQATNNGTELWEWSNYVPGLVIMNVGTTEHHGPQLIPLVTHYLDTLYQIVTQYNNKNLPIILQCGPNEFEYCRDMQQAAEETQLRGMAFNVHLQRLPPVPYSDRCASHPNVRFTEDVLLGLMVDFIRNVTGWR